MRYAAQKGTRDILPQEIYNWQKAEKTFADVCHSFGYEEIRIPTFEQTDLFQRGVGDTTDVVTKEMYTFEDKGGRSITLRPEGTAGVVRSFIENGMTSLPSPVRMFYNITAFRYEKMQKGRMREFHQFGLESFGAAGPDIDAEIISVVDVFFKKMGLKNIALHINSIGCPACRGEYNKLLKDYFRPHVATMCEDCQARFEKNPLRMIDCKVDGGKDIVKNAPRLIDHLCDDCKAHFEALKTRLEAIGISYTIDPNPIYYDPSGKYIFVIRNSTLDSEYFLFCLEPCMTSVDIYSSDSGNETEYHSDDAGEVRAVVDAIHELRLEKVEEDRPELAMAENYTVFTFTDENGYTNEYTIVGIYLIHGEDVYRIDNPERLDELETLFDRSE